MAKRQVRTKTETPVADKQTAETKNETVVVKETPVAEGTDAGTETVTPTGDSAGTDSDTDGGDTTSTEGTTATTEGSESTGDSGPVDTDSKEDPADNTPDVVPPVDPTPAANPAPDAAATPAETQEARHARIRAEAKEKARLVPWSHVEEYLDKMHPSRPNNRDTIVGHQSRLSQAFILLLAEESDDTVAIESIKKLVAIIRERRKPGSVFHDSMCMRFVNDLGAAGMTTVRITEFQNILFALLEIADKGSKVVLDWEVFAQRCIKGRGEIIASRLQRACNVKID